MVSLVAWWNAIGLEQADYLAISGHPVLDNHGGVDLVFQVVTRRYNLGDEQPGRIALELAQLPVVPTEARMLTPVPGTQLESDVVLFDWTEGFDVTAYQLNVGSTLGASDYSASGAILTTSASVTLPAFTTPGTVYVRLYSQIGGVWLANDYTYARYYVLDGTGAFIAPCPRLAGLGGLAVEGTAHFIAPCGIPRGGEQFWIPPDTDLFWTPPDSDLFWVPGLGVDRFVAPAPRLAGAGGISYAGTAAFIAPAMRLAGSGGGATELYWTGTDSDLTWTGADSDVYW
jgi:hypothetical protein